jgi:hypothetical protein
LLVAEPDVQGDLIERQPRSDEKHGMFIGQI